MAQKMRKFIKHLHHDTVLGYFLIHPIYRIYEIIVYQLIPEKFFLKVKFKQIFGFPLDLKNPKTINEKIQWIKLYDRTPLHTLVSDKYAVREYVKNKIGEKYLIPLVFHSKNPKDIVPENFPDSPFIIKVNHDSGTVIIVHDKSKADWKSIRRTLRRLLRRNYYYKGKEWQYKNIEPCIIAEELLAGENGKVPFDYKIHCFNGKPRIIQVDIDRFIDHRRNLYNIDWELLPFSWSTTKKGKLKSPVGRLTPVPSNLNEMLMIAEKLSSDFYYARVDLYEVEGRIYFGEITLTHCNGFDAISPFEWDIKVGDMLTLPIK